MYLLWFLNQNLPSVTPKDNFGEQCPRDTWSCFLSLIWTHVCGNLPSYVETCHCSLCRLCLCIKDDEVLSVCCLCCAHLQACCSSVSCNRVCVMRSYTSAVLGPKQFISVLSLLLSCRRVLFSLIKMFGFFPSFPEHPILPLVNFWVALFWQVKWPEWKGESGHD